MTNEAKETTQYITAIFTLFTGIVMCFLSFFLNDYIVHDSALWYFGETIAFAGGVFGIGIYVNSKVKNAELRLNTKIDKRLDTIDKLFDTEKG